MGRSYSTFLAILCRVPNSNFFSSTPVNDPAPGLQYAEDGGSPGHEAGQDEDEGGDGTGGCDGSSLTISFKSKRG